MQKIYAHADMGVLHPLWNKNRLDPLGGEFLDVEFKDRVARVDNYFLAKYFVGQNFNHAFI